jgi:hypothetical protein
MDDVPWERRKELAMDPRAAFDRHVPSGTWAGFGVWVVFGAAAAFGLLVLGSIAVLPLVLAGWLLARRRAIRRSAFGALSGVGAVSLFVATCSGGARGWCAGIRQRHLDVTSTSTPGHGSSWVPSLYRQASSSSRVRDAQHRRVRTPLLESRCETLSLPMGSDIPDTSRLA